MNTVLNRIWPRCDYCQDPAIIVSVSPKSGAEGFQGSDDEDHAIFSCNQCSDAPTATWYWFWIGKRSETAKTDPSMWDRDFLTHVCNKTWGAAFIGWLLATYDLSPHAESAAFFEQTVGCEDASE